MQSESENEKKQWRKMAGGDKDLPPIYNFIDKPLEAGLWCLLVSKEYFNKQYLTAGIIENILVNYLDIKIKAMQITRAFARAKNKVNYTKEGYKSCYPGDNYIRSLKVCAPLNVVYLRPDKPFTAKKTLEALIKSIKKDNLLISDPYYGLKTFELLESMMAYHKSLKFLTSQIGNGEKRAILNQLLKDLKKEYGNKIQIRAYPNRKELHDRYILAQNTFFIIGHGLKNLGEKESLIVAIEDKYGKDIRKILEKEFNKRWVDGKLL